MLRTIFIALVCVAMLAAGARAFDVPPPHGHVDDTAGLLPADTRAWLEGELDRISRDTGLQVAVLTVKTLGGDTPEAAAQQVFDAWKIGRKGDDRGLLFLVASEDHKTRIQPGYGLEAQLPDGKLGAILDEQVVPRFRQGDWAGGIVGGLKAALEPLGVALSGARPHAGRPAGNELSPAGVLGLIVLLVLIVLGCAVSPAFRFIVLEMLLTGSGFGGRRSDGGGGGFGGGSSGGGGASRGW